MKSEETLNLNFLEEIKIKILENSHFKIDALS
jgi:hypothetical protein